MANYGKVFLTMGLLSLVYVLPLAAQVGDGVEFKTSFPFYVGRTKLPAGSYMLTEPDDLNFSMIIVRSDDGRFRTATAGVVGTQSLQPARQTTVVFEKYGDTLYLDKVSLDGDTSGLMVLPTKAEKAAEENASVGEERSITASGL